MKSGCMMFFLLLASLFSCSKNTGNAKPDVAPANLIVNASVKDDKSGSVTFTASATNAVSYDYDFGNGIYETSLSGAITYKYPNSGSYTVNVTAKSKSGLKISKTITVVVTVALSLVWSDEFNTAGAPDASKWGYDIGTGSGGWGNNELQYYTNRVENAMVSNGLLKITAIKENYSGSAYSSARLLTKNKFSKKYGKIEARAKLPVGVGTWPAIWMLGNNINAVGWPACGEIDIMEHKGSDQNRVYGTLHHPNHAGGNADGGTIVIPTTTTEFHNYAVEWNAEIIQFSVDGNVFYTFNNKGNLPFNQDFFIILNVAMGGTFGGPIDPSFNSASMEVDYVRVYN